jgi:hypothetical protein
MDDDFTHTDETYTPRRSLNATFEGDSANEIELAALDEARKLFGSGIQLRIMPDYTVFMSANPDRKRYGATVTVVTVEDLT